MVEVCPYICNNKTDYGYCKTSACINPRRRMQTFTDVAPDNIQEASVYYEPSYTSFATNAIALADFANWVAEEIFGEDGEAWERNYTAFPELACRRLYKLGIVFKKDDCWTLEP